MPTSVETTSSQHAIEEHQRRVAEARNMVVCDPEILSGTPVIRGTRVPVYYLAACIESGEPMERILEAYPSVSREQVELAALFSQAFPPRDEPVQRPELPPGATLIYSHPEPWLKRA
jgi:uncharacterized protein (DUF433 family)